MVRHQPLVRVAETYHTLRVPLYSEAALVLGDNGTIEEG